MLFGGDFVRGAGEGLWDAGSGLVELGKGAWSLAINEGDSRAKFKQTVQTIVEHPDEATGAVWEGIKAPYQDAVESGHSGKALGRGAADVFTTVVGPKGLTNLGKVGKASAVVSKPFQKHHFIPWNNSKWTPQFKKITEKYKLNLENSAWNQELLPHSGRHPTACNEWVLSQLRNADDFARDDQEKFFDYLDEHLKDFVRDNPDMLDKGWWTGT